MSGFAGQTGTRVNAPGLTLKRHLLIDTLGLVMAIKVHELADRLRCDDALRAEA